MDKYILRVSIGGEIYTERYINFDDAWNRMIGELAEYCEENEIAYYKCGLDKNSLTAWADGYSYGNAYANWRINEIALPTH